MAKYERQLTGDFHGLLAAIEEGILRGLSNFGGIGR